MRAPFVLLALAALPAALPAQSFEGSKWSIEQEGVDTVAHWWLGSQGRVRTGDVGTILPGYKWRQAGDSIFVTVGDTLRYTGQLISSRFVGIRSGPRRQEGWWSGSRADAPTTVAAAAPAAAPTTTATEQMNRPVEPAGGITAGSAPPRTLRRIERADGSGTPSSSAPSGGQEIRRIQRGNALPAAPPVPASVLVGRWVQADSGGVITSIEFKDDGSAILGLNTGNKGSGTWTNESDGTTLVVGGARREAVVRVRHEGGELRFVVQGASGSPVTRRFRRAG
jgi:hypothetical protein